MSTIHDNASLYDLQELQHQSLEQSHKLKVHMITCLSLDVFLEVFDISVNETGGSIQTKLLFPGSALFFFSQDPVQS